VLAGLEVAHVQALHATATKSVHLAGGVQVAGNNLIVHLEFDRIQRQELTGLHAQEDRELGAGGEQQVFLQHEQVAVQLDHLLAEFLDAHGHGIRFIGVILGLDQRGPAKHQRKRPEREPAEWETLVCCHNGPRKFRWSDLRGRTRISQYSNRMDARVTQASKPYRGSCPGR
jgi:hypothetical protein